MQNRSRARAELEALYAARAPLYARAHAIVDTDALSLDDVVEELIATSKSALEPR
jgi:shikimate kinase